MYLNLFIHRKLPNATSPCKMLS